MAGLFEGLNGMDALMIGATGIAGVRAGGTANAGLIPSLGLAQQLVQQRQAERKQEHSQGFLGEVLSGNRDFGNLAQKYKFADPQIMNGLLGHMLTLEEQNRSRSLAEAANIRAEDRAYTRTQETEQRAAGRVQETEQRHLAQQQKESALKASGEVGVLPDKQQWGMLDALGMQGPWRTPSDAVASRPELSSGVLGAITQANTARDDARQDASAGLSREQFEETKAEHRRAQEARELARKDLEEYRKAQLEIRRNRGKSGGKQPSIRFEEQVIGMLGGKPSADALTPELIAKAANEDPDRVPMAIAYVHESWKLAKQRGDEQAGAQLTQIMLRLKQLSKHQPPAKKQRGGFSWSWGD